MSVIHCVTGKGNVHLTTRHKGPEREYRCSFTLSFISALGGGGWSTSHPGRFIPGRDPVPIVQDVGWAPGYVWSAAENLAHTCIRSPDRPARSELQYRLSCPGSLSLCMLYV